MTKHYFKILKSRSAFGVFRVPQILNLLERSQREKNLTTRRAKLERKGLVCVFL